MTRHTLRREQRFALPIEEVFRFFADAGNLEAITPPWLGFQILTPLPMSMGTGQLIQYKLHWHRMPIRWTTEIRRWEPPHGFVDMQLRGPYRHWEHTHEFQSIEGGTLMRDVVHYALPLGVLGRLMHAWIVKADLERIFDYRATQVAKLLTQAHHHA